MIVMPPIECPPSTTGPLGASWSITAARSFPSWSIVISAFGWVGECHVERPCPRWS
jgi:hypothetical protein